PVSANRSSKVARIGLLTLAMPNSSVAWALRPFGPSTPAAPLQVPPAVITAAMASGWPSATIPSMTAWGRAPGAAAIALVGTAPTSGNGVGDGSGDGNGDACECDGSEEPVGTTTDGLDEACPVTAVARLAVGADVVEQPTRTTAAVTIAQSRRRV